MNYHLVSENEGLDYLIDICDVYEDRDEMEEHGGLMWDDLKELADIEEILPYAWQKNEWWV